MDSTSSVSGFIQAFAALFHQFPVLQQMIDITIKSIVLLTLFLLIDLVVGKKLNNTSRHLLWLNGLLCLALLPFLPMLYGWWQQFLPDNIGQPEPGVLFELPVYASQTSGLWPIDWGNVAQALYLIPALVLSSRLLLALRSLTKLRRQSIAVTDSAALTLLTALKRQLGISRPVTLMVSNRIESPISYGLLRPQIMLPVQSADWSTSTMTDVLLHELCHIKRLDWLTTLMAYVLASLFWVNPLVWLAVRRLREESENSCDTAVLNAGRSDTDYAESLLGVATSCIQARRKQQNLQQFNRTNRSSYPLVQTMLDQNTLKTRISRVLEENKMNATELKRQFKSSVVILLAVSAGALGVLGSHQLLYAQPQPDPATREVDAEMLPLVSVEPRYPTLAAESGIEGWVHVRFTVSAEGGVVPESLEVLEAEPADVFNNSALAAATQFKFSPRVVDGWPVDVPNVQYVFRYRLSADPAQAAQQP